MFHRIVSLSVCPCTEHQQFYQLINLDHMQHAYVRWSYVLLTRQAQPQAYIALIVKMVFKFITFERNFRLYLNFPFKTKQFYSSRSGPRERLWWTIGLLQREKCETGLHQEGLLHPLRAAGGHHGHHRNIQD